ncbi:PREDICTED: LOW QUALITY PROTEIN: TM2 domain-containing protein 3-like [Myotis davidii]|uniref:LOW QUALITY PROTEIN: TM2 domain-containing protein 3-like n=1 Tax=Myotis davidii TaxID=225400 RepID=UPI000766E2A9|nr:PREDICTED: LOW QUALITY PROTEIN: TM2 domain-containing protein 3-like [Myotis davidii]
MELRNRLRTADLEHSQPLAQARRDPGAMRTFTVVPRAAESTDVPPYVLKCLSNGLCSRLPANCVECRTNFCVYGKPVTFDCTVKPSVTCVGQVVRPQKHFIINMTCQFCWQLPETDYECSSSTSCMTVSCPRQHYTANCRVRDHVHGLGHRTFPKMLYCNWTGGYKWSTALAMSITFGGFGADRFDLGQWREGLGKLFSFGGLGIWSLIHVLLIGVGYLGPADGSLYVYRRSVLGGERHLEEGLGPEEVMSRVTYLYVFNVQHLYVACLDEGKI